MKLSKSSRPNGCGHKAVIGFSETPKNEVRSRLYMGFGTGMRNQFGLWGDNQPLRDSCATNDPEGCSVVILDRLWESVRGDADPALVQQLECQFHLVQAVHVSLKGFHQMTTRYMIRRLQSQIDSQLAALASSGVSGCQSALTLDVAGKPNMATLQLRTRRKNANCGMTLPLIKL
jgi:hypothetical protein